jgi:ribosomal protein S27AE
VHQFYRINDYLDDKQFCKRVGHCGFTKDHKRTYCCEKCKATVKNYLNIQ